MPDPFAVVYELYECNAIVEYSPDPIPGHCECGCGTPIPAAERTERRYMPGHRQRVVRWAVVDMGHDTPCHAWIGSHHKSGYGRLSFCGRTVPAHRWAYEHFVGPIPEGLQIDHLCRTRSCVNPAHLEAVTQAENVRRGISPWAQNARKTHCKRGHEFTPANAYVGPVGWRRCRACAREYQARRHAA